MKKITERMIAKAKLSKEEAKVIRFIHKLPSAGQRTKKWAANLNNRKYLELVVSANEKLDIATNPQNQKGSGK